MSGHSKWSTIKRQKGVADIKKGLTFTKIANAITIAVKQGSSGDPDSNPKLRMVIESARSVNMPKDNIDRAIKRGLGEGKEALEEVTYEGFGPGKVAFIALGVTDNKLRTNQQIKSIFDRNGGILAGPGAVSYMFRKIGEIRVKSKGGSSEDEMLELIDLGAEDVQDFIDDNVQSYLVYTEATNVNEVSNKIVQSGFEVESQDLVMKPVITQKITDPGQVERVIEFAQKIEESDDVQKVFSNYETLTEQT